MYHCDMLGYVITCQLLYIYGLYFSMNYKQILLIDYSWEADYLHRNVYNYTKDYNLIREQQQHFLFEDIGQLYSNQTRINMGGGEH